MPRALTVQNAEINTASITIRTLQVEGRQVTMGVFRQLQVENIVEEDGPSLKGVGWGYVNYLLDDYEAKQNAIHLVWQKGNDLRRCFVRPKITMGKFYFAACPNHWHHAKDMYAKELAEYYAARDVEEAKHQVDENWCQRHNTLVAPLFDLPQLFIAV